MRAVDPPHPQALIDCTSACALVTSKFTASSRSVPISFHPCCTRIFRAKADGGPSLARAQTYTFSFSYPTLPDGTSIPILNVTSNGEDVAQVRLRLFYLSIVSQLTSATPG